MHKNVRKVISSLAALVMAGTLILPCGCAKKTQLIIYNWGEYIAEDTIAKKKYRKSVYESIGGFDETYDALEDWDFIMGQALRNNILLFIYKHSCGEKFLLI